MRTAAIITYDIGTTACKAVVFGVEGQVLAQAEHEYPVYYPRPLWAEHDPEHWWEAVLLTTHRLREMLDARWDTLDFAAIGLSSQRETVVPVARDGTELGRAILWLDRRSSGQADELVRVFGRERLHQKTGMIPDATFTATKLLWLRQNEPDIFRDAGCFLQPKEFICFKLTGERATEPSLASRTMMLDIRTLSWWDEIFDYLGLRPSKFPPILRSDQAVGGLLPDAARLLGLPPGIPVAAGGGDRQCEALGASIFGGRAMESTGTTSNVSYASPEVPERLDPRALCSCHVVQGMWLLEQGLTTTGAILRWFRDQFCADLSAQGLESGTSAYELISRQAGESPPGAKGLLLHPFFMGAKSTRWNPRARGVLFGLTLNHTRGDVARAIMEGVAYEIRACFDVLKGMGVMPAEVILMGGGARARVWNQIKSDVTGMAFSVPRVTDAASLGAMILAGTACGALGNPADASRRLNPILEHYSPVRDRSERYAQLFETYQELYEAVEPLFGRVDNASEGR